MCLCLSLSLSVCAYGTYLHQFLSSLINSSSLLADLFCRPSQNAQDLIRALIQSDPMQRLDLDRCLAHPWVSTSAGSLSKVLNEVRRPAFKRRFFSGRSGSIIPTISFTSSPTDTPSRALQSPIFTNSNMWSKHSLGGDRQAPPEEREEPFQLPGDPSKDRSPCS